MTQDEFQQLLSDEGFGTPVEVNWAPNQHNEAHAHDFTARGLILEGTMRLTQGGEEQECKVGDTFFVAAGTPHVELAGGEGVKILVGRK